MMQVIMSLFSWRVQRQAFTLWLGNFSLIFCSFFNCLFWDIDSYASYIYLSKLVCVTFRAH